MNNEQTQHPPFNEFLEQLKQRMKQVFHVRANIDQMAIKRGMPPFVMREIMNLKPLATGIPAEYGGRGCKMDESIALWQPPPTNPWPCRLLLATIRRWF